MKKFKFVVFVLFMGVVFVGGCVVGEYLQGFENGQSLSVELNERFSAKAVEGEVSRITFRGVKRGSDGLYHSMQICRDEFILPICQFSEAIVLDRPLPRVFFKGVAVDIDEGKWSVFVRTRVIEESTISPDEMREILFKVVGRVVTNVEFYKQRVGDESAREQNLKAWGVVN